MKYLYDDAELLNLSTANIHVKLFHMEQVLNEYSGKRYHIRQNIADRYDLIEVKKIGKEIYLVNDVTEEQMYSWLKRNLKVTLQNNDSVRIEK